MNVRLTDVDNAECDRLLELWPDRPGDKYRTADRKKKQARIGIRGEYVVAKLLGQDVFDAWKRHDQHEIDVGKAVQVKSIDSEHRNLCIPHYDRRHESCAFVLAIVLRDQVRVAGWRLGCDVMHDDFFVESGWRSYWLFPQELLLPFSTLPQELVR